MSKKFYCGHCKLEIAGADIIYPREGYSSANFRIKPSTCPYCGRGFMGYSEHTDSIILHTDKSTEVKTNAGTL